MPRKAKPVTPPGTQPFVASEPPQPSKALDEGSPLEPLLTINETAAVLKASRGAIYKILPLLDAKRVCGRWKCAPSKVREYMRAGDPR